MNPLIACVLVGMAGVTLAEPPSGYNYNRPSGGFGGGGGGGFGGGFGGYSGGGGLGGGGGGYTQVSSGGYQSNEGANVDPALLEQLKSIIIKEEASSGAGGYSGGGGGGFGGGYPSGGPSGSYGPPSGSYGPPSSSYGVPGVGGGRVVGIDFENIRQAIEVAQLHQASQGSGGGYPSGGGGGYPSGRPSSSYGAPF
ncbi:uncharacterized protein LOC131669365 [Phymastichus coffea]|uniref:uncharacterized protein LOC131669365 n=1 Tax=Phymastichus coffea TaxID=108790 RepID=UPI00273C4882|nr:uncharacterized protein LOC131669365 [Phymastichus coffea]